MTASSDDDRFRPGFRDWAWWLQIALSTAMVVLFAVMVVNSRRQSRSIRVLEQRIQGLENSRALDRTAAVEEQLRAMVSRLQKLEARESRMDGPGGLLQRFDEELLDLRGGSDLPGADDLPLPRPLQAVSPRSRPPRSDAGDPVLRPPINP